MANILSVRGLPTQKTLNPFALDGSRFQVQQGTGAASVPYPGVNTGGPLPPRPGTVLQDPNDYLLPGVPGVNTGGPLPPQQGVPLQNPNDFIVPGPIPLSTVNTGGPLPPQTAVRFQNPNDFMIPSMPTNVNTGGPLPPSVGQPLQNPNDFMLPNVAPVNTGGPLPPQASGSLDGSRFVATSTGGGPTNSVTSTIDQLAQQYGYAPGTDPATITRQIAGEFAQPAQPRASEVSLGIMDDILSRENSYIRNARLRGLEQANSRGLMNSSIGAGSAERAAIEASMPIFNQTMNLTSQREQQAWQEAQNQFNAAMQLEGQARDAALAQARDAFSAAQSLTQQREQQGFLGEQSALDRTQGVNNALLSGALSERQMGIENQYQQERARLDTELRRQLQSDSVTQQDWLTDRQFQREFNGALSTMAIGGAYDLNQAIMEYAASNPEVYTPEIISGMTSFFQMNMAALLQEYFPDLPRGNG